MFQDRFRSEVVQDDTYMLGVLRYIHNNPVKAKMVKDILEYKWSSVNEYTDSNSDLISSYYLSEILDLFNNKKEFEKFHNISDDIIYIDTKEEKQDNIENIVTNIIENFANENEIIDQVQFSQIKRSTKPLCGGASRYSNKNKLNKI